MDKKIPFIEYIANADHFNNLTHFATHTDLLAEDDIRRTAIHQMAMQGLASKHDIKNYIEY